MNDLNALVMAAQSAFEGCHTQADLENAKAQFLGKTGRVTELMKGLASLPTEEKKLQGAAINQAKQAVEMSLTQRRQALADDELASQLKAQALDVGLPGRLRPTGGLHPVSLTLERIEQIFDSMGFEVAQGPEIETDWYNFTALNTPEDHPARSMHDTFYVEGGYLLRTHTSPMQIRHAVSHVKRHQALLDAGQTMPEIRVIAPGRTIVWTAMRPIPRCSTSVKVCGLERTSVLKTSKWCSLTFAGLFLSPQIWCCDSAPAFFPSLSPVRKSIFNFPVGLWPGVGSKWLALAKCIPRW